MGTFVHLQNRLDPSGTKIVVGWDTETPEAFCASDDSAFTDTAHRVIVHGTDRCALHGLAEFPCVVSYRMPAECRHEQLDPTAAPETPRCSTCGRHGADMTARYGRSSFAALPGPAPDEVWGDDAVLLGPPAEPEAS
jgi:hypothetical protein